MSQLHLFHALHRPRSRRERLTRFHSGIGWLEIAAILALVLIVAVSA